MLKQLLEENFPFWFCLFWSYQLSMEIDSLWKKKTNEHKEEDFDRLSSNVIMQIYDHSKTILRICIPRQRIRKKNLRWYHITLCCSVRGFDLTEDINTRFQTNDFFTILLSEKYRLIYRFFVGRTMTWVCSFIMMMIWTAN